MGRRREDRIIVRLPVRVWGMDGNGKPFSQTAHTVDVTRLGGRLSDLNCVEKTGEIIGIQHAHEKARFKVVWIGPPGPDAGLVGVHCIEPGKYIWGVGLSTHSYEDRYKLAMEMVPAGEVHHHSGQRLASDAGAKPVAKQNRAHDRYPCTGTAEVLPDGSQLPVWCQISDISASGCYAETISPLPKHARVRVTLKSSIFEVIAKGAVRTSHPGVGMGISFGEMSPADKDRLNSLLRVLEEQSKKPATMPVAVAAAAAAPARTASVPAPGAAIPPSRKLGPARGNGAANETAGLSARINKLNIEMQEIHHALLHEQVDPRVLREFRESIDHARKAAWTAQQWVQLQEEKRDPFAVLPELYEARVRAAVATNQHLAVDLDAGDLALDTKGLHDLHKATLELEKRLAKFLKK